MLQVNSIEQLTCGACIWQAGPHGLDYVKCTNHSATNLSNYYRERESFCNQGQWIVYSTFHKRPLICHRAEAIENLLMPDDWWKTDNLDNIQDIQDALKDIREQIDQQKNNLNNVDICNIPLR